MDQLVIERSLTPSNKKDKKNNAVGVNYVKVQRKS